MGDIDILVRDYRKKKNIMIIDLTISALKMSAEVSNCRQMCLNITQPLMISPNCYVTT